jgi:hypothetical protein
MAAARELARYKLDLVGVQVWWDKEGTVKVGIIVFFHGKVSDPWRKLSKY